MKYFIILLMLVNVSLAQNILHVTRTQGYDHNTRNQSLSMFTSIANANNWNIDNVSNSGIFDNLTSLLNYDLIIFSNTSGNVLNSSTRQDNLRTWFYTKPNASFLGIHAAFDTHVGATNFSFYSDTLVGGTVQQGPNHTANNYPGIIDHIGTHPTLTGIPNPWNKPEEYYYWRNAPGFVNNNFTETMRVRSTGPRLYDEPRMVTHYNEYPGGQKVFATSLGHNRSDFNTGTTFSELMENACTWLLSNSSSFGIKFPDVKIDLVFEDGYYYMDTAPVIPTYYVYNSIGQLLHTGQIQEYNGKYRFPIYTNNSSMIIYRGYGFIKKTIKWT